MGAQHFRLGVLRAQLFHDIVPQYAACAHLGDLHEEVHANAPEERQARREGIDIEAGFHRAFHVFLAVGNGEGQLLYGRRPRFVHVIAADGNAVEARHVLAGVGDDVRHDPHAGRRRIDVGVADHELLQNVVLDGAAQLFRADAGAFGGDDVERKDRDHRAVHRHRHAHGVERDLVEQDFHVAHGVDRDARLADIADDARMVRIIPAMGGQIERDREALLPRRQVAAIEGVRFLGGGEARILADGPRAARVHAGIGTARERLETGQAGIQPLGIRRCIQRLHIDSLRRVPGEIAALHFLGSLVVPVFKRVFFAHVKSLIQTRVAVSTQCAIGIGRSRCCIEGKRDADRAGQIVRVGTRADGKGVSINARAAADGAAVSAAIQRENYAL